MFEQSQVVQSLGERLISDEEQFVHLSNCKICYLRSDHTKQANGKTVFADTRKVSDMWKAISGFDFVITFYADAFCEEVTDKGRELLMKHELMHVGYEPETEKCRILPHDVDDFRELIEENGFDWLRSE